MRSLLKCAILAGAASLAACANTEFVSTWKAPDAQSLKGEGSKVVAVAMTRNESTRRAAEDAMAREITRQGAQGVPGYSLIQDEATPDEAKAKEAIEKAGINIIVVMRPTAATQQITASPAYSGAYWGGYYGYGWGSAYGPATEIRTDTIVYIETLVYSTKQNKLVWSAQSKTTNPSNVDSLVKEVVNAVAIEMKKAGLI
jgi:hypothetical protein